MSKKRSEEEWQAILTTEQFRILRQMGTELPNTGEYNKFKGKDLSNNMKRVEITCAACDGHLGHVFQVIKFFADERHCVNSVSIKFSPEEEEKKD
ncbi:2197_t:CDS:2 [Racocetra fulgida]|uniref:2197_t:CDS:1 n=1 Tax=Racocetra fulgida TaxID=60492 RepID=A0A9N9BTR1_9GLOM|nr:2197_t:CDS:2 [Racocetra fulgida]